ncbi:MAG: hypothetical protein NVS4B8_15740 [Herpetosiphon sp.]
MRKLNLILAELGWIDRADKGWVATTQGLALGAVQKAFHQTKVPYVSWPEPILANPILHKSIAAVNGNDLTPPTEQRNSVGFREKFPATHRTTDGHLVRSKAEMLIDNWLYMSGIVHAYERQLPIEEEVYCDFYIPSGKVYIEYWGLEREPQYAARQKTKRDLYQKYKLHLIELIDEQIRNLDDVLPKLLLKHQIIVL